MILIISTGGTTVNQVIDWINANEKVVHRVNPIVDKIVLREVKLTNTIQDIEIVLGSYNITTRLSDYTAVWIWHGYLSFSNCRIDSELAIEGNLVNKIKNSLINHHRILIEYFGEFLCFTNAKTIGNYNIQSLNKLVVLKKASDCGLLIPSSHIVSSKKQILELKKNSNIVTKPYHEVIYIEYNGSHFQNYTTEITDKSAKNIEEELFPTLIQEKIIKAFEIRSFYLLGKFYSMAIFSQESASTQTDWRHYDNNFPNRTVSYSLPSEITKKLRKLFITLNLNSGSVDLIYSTDNKYVFLEINPIGQFGMVSYPCNYYLEKIIAEELING